jgi:hypothetical protein
MRHGTRFAQDCKPEEATETLFGPAPEPAPQLSADQRLTKRNNDLLESGKHPATLLPLLGSDARCGTCAHHQHLAHHNRSYHKCDEHRLGITHSTSSDVRVSWPACTKYEAV